MATSIDKNEFNSKKHTFKDDIHFIHWSKINRMITMLTLSIAQIKISISEGDESVDQLTKSFIVLVDDIKIVLGDVKSDLNGSDTDEVKDKIDVLSNDITSRVSDGVVAFQFYDRLTQRLDHIAKSLGDISTILKDKDKANTDETWTELQQNVREGYSMEEERKVFDAIMEGKTIEEAVDIYLKMADSHDDLDSQQTGNVEVF